MSRLKLFGAAAAGGVALAGAVALAGPKPPAKEHSMATLGVAPAVGKGQPQRFGTGKLASGASSSAAPIYGTTGPRPPLAPQDAHPSITAAVAKLENGRPAIPGTIRVVATQADPAGGAPWAVRTFKRRGQNGHAIWCTQLGRQVDGQFVWIQPGAHTASPLFAGETETTSCAISAPIARRLGVQIASLPDRKPEGLEPQLATTVIWGAVDRHVRSARLDYAGHETAIELHGHAFLRVLPGTSIPTRARLFVTDSDGKTRAAIPPAFFDLQRDGRFSDYAADPGELEEIGTVPRDDNALPGGLFVRRAGHGRPTCAAGPIPSIDGIAVQPDRSSGLVRAPQVQCEPFPAKADKRPVWVGGGWVTGNDAPPHSDQARIAKRRRIERRIPDSNGGVLVAVPRGTALLEVHSPVGIKTVRVGPSRVTWIGWEGQPEVRDAMFPHFEHPDLAKIKRTQGAAAAERASVLMRVQKPVWLEPPLTFTALDARGHQIGQTGTTRQ